MSLTETVPKVRACSRCLVLVLDCWCEGLWVVSDVVALSLQGQIHALQAGRELYQIELSRVVQSSTAYLIFRNESRIAGGKPHIALAQHSCYAQLKEFSDGEAQSRLDRWLYPATPQAESHIPPF